MKGGNSAAAMELITGKKSYYYEDNDAWAIKDRLPGAADSLDNGGAAVISSLQKGDFPGGAEEVEITVEKREDGKLVEHDVTLVGSHAYTVERIEADGTVWIRNPHGAGNNADGGGALRLSQEDVDKYFWRIQYSEGIS